MYTCIPKNLAYVGLDLVGCSWGLKFWISRKLSVGVYVAEWQVLLSSKAGTSGLMGLITLQICVMCAFWTLLEIMSKGLAYRRHVSKSVLGTVTHSVFQLSFINNKAAILISMCFISISIPNRVLKMSVCMCVCCFKPKSDLRSTMTLSETSFQFSSPHRQ